MFSSSGTLLCFIATATLALGEDEGDTDAEKEDEGLIEELGDKEGEAEELGEVEDDGDRLGEVLIGMGLLNLKAIQKN